MKMSCFTYWVIVYLLKLLVAIGSEVNAVSGAHMYTREELLLLIPHLPNVCPQVQLPEDCKELLRNSRTRNRISSKKRGSRGGVRQRLKRRGHKPPLPVITLSNVRSLKSKTDELLLKAKYDSDFRQSNLICFTETWLKDGIQDIDISGYTMIRADRNVAEMFGQITIILVYVPGLCGIMWKPGAK